MTPRPVSPGSAVPGVAPPGALPDRLTLIAVSSLAYIVAVALHEHLGHAAACVLLGSHPTELGAFYVNCDNARLGSLAIRLHALAGPVVSLATGFVSFRILRHVPAEAAATFYFVWLLGSIGLMMAAGYLLFSGVSGIGDLGTTPDGVFHGFSPEWAWRVALSACGVVAYGRVARWSMRVLAPRLSGPGSGRVRCATVMTLTSYLVGATVYLAIGLLNPYGLVIVATSALASSMGGTSALLWMTRRLDRNLTVPGPGLYFGRSWAWIGVAGAITLTYAVVLGPTLRP